MSSREQIERWMRLVFIGECVASDLIANGHALAAAYRLSRQPGMAQRPLSGVIIAAIEQATSDDDAVATGFALSCETILDDLDSLTDCDSRLRRGYVIGSLGVRGGSPLATKWRAEADVQLQDAVDQYHKNSANETLLAAVSGDVLGCMRCHYTSSYADMARVALDLVTW